MILTSICGYGMLILALSSAVLISFIIACLVDPKSSALHHARIFQSILEAPSSARIICVSISVIMDSMFVIAFCRISLVASISAV